MPLEHVYAGVTTVHPGDLPILAARSLPDLAAVPQLDRPASPPDHDVLRRRHQLLSRFVEDLDRARVTVGGEAFEAVFSRRLEALHAELARLPLDDPPAEPTDDPTGLDLNLREPVTSSPDGPTASELHVSQLRRVQLRVCLGWERDGGQVTLGVDGWDHDRAERVDLGGLHAALDWSAANRLARKVKVARDQSCGVPE